jgi:hypothetical protein
MQQQCMAFDGDAPPPSPRQPVDELAAAGGTSLQPSIIAISYVLHFSALPGIETEVFFYFFCILKFNKT